MDVQLFKDAYMQKFMNNGPEMAAIVTGIPKEDGRIGPAVQMDVLGVGADEVISPIGVFGNEANPAAAKYGLPPFMRTAGPMRGAGSSLNPMIPGGIPGVSGFNEAATREHYPQFMDEVKPGYMPAYRR